MCLEFTIVHCKESPRKHRDVCVHVCACVYLTLLMMIASFVSCAVLFNAKLVLGMHPSSVTLSLFFHPMSLGPQPKELETLTSDQKVLP